MREEFPVLKFWKVAPSYIDRSVTPKKKVKAVLPPPYVVERICCSTSGNYDLPSENVVFGNVRPIIQQGRYWRTFQFYAEHHKWEKDAAGRKSESSHNEWTALIEIYEDSGCDGHIEYELVGFAAVREEMLEKFLAAIENAKHRWEYPRWKIPYEEIYG